MNTAPDEKLIAAIKRYTRPILNFTSSWFENIITMPAKPKISDAVLYLFSLSLKKTLASIITIMGYVYIIIEDNEALSVPSPMDQKPKNNIILNNPKMNKNIFALIDFGNLIFLWNTINMNNTATSILKNIMYKLDS